MGGMGGRRKLLRGDAIEVHWYDPVTYLGWFDADEERGLHPAVTRGFFIAWQKSPVGRVLRMSHGKQKDGDEWEDLHLLPKSLISDIKRD